MCNNKTNSSKINKLSKKLYNNSTRELYRIPLYMPSLQKMYKNWQRFSNTEKNLHFIN